MTSILKKITPIILLTLLAGLISAVGCKKSESMPFVPESGDFTVNIPLGWGYMSSAESLKPLTDKLAEELKNRKLKMVPILEMSSSQGSFRAILAEPVATPPRATPAIKQLIPEAAMLMGMSSGIANRTNNQMIITSETVNDNGSVSKKMLIATDNRIYSFIGTTSTNSIAAEAETIRKIFASISLNPADIQSARDRFESFSAGFITGLWQGALLPFRLIASIFSDLSIVARPNTGLGYWLGYAIGFILLVKLLFPRRAKPIPDDEEKERESSTDDDSQNNPETQS